MRSPVEPFYIVCRQVFVGPVDLSLRALSGRRKFTVRRHEFNKDCLVLTRVGLVQDLVLTDILP